MQASVQGIVIDENNNPVPGATVKSGASSTVTDAKGIFRFNNIQMDKYASVVSVEYNGYFKCIRTFWMPAAIRTIPKVFITYFL